MRNKILIIAAIVLGLILSMTLINCEKDSDISPIPETTDFTATSLETSPYISDAELEDLRYEIEKTSVDMNTWKRVPVNINFQTKVSYEYLNTSSDALPPTQSIIFKGQGRWVDVGEVTYTEKTSLITSPLEQSWRGEGVIALTKPNDLSTVQRDNEILFKSGLRAEEMIVDKPGDRVLPRPSKIIKSKIEFNGGEGIYRDAVGRAYKIETYFANDNSYCDTYFQGYLYIRKRAAVGPQADM